LESVRVDPIKLTHDGQMARSFNSD